MNPNTRQGLAAALSGLGAGMQGNAAQFMLAQQKDMQLRDEKRRRAMHEDAVKIHYLLGMKDYDGVNRLLTDRYQSIMKLGGDPKNTLWAIERMKAGDYDTLANDMQGVISAGIANKEIDPDYVTAMTGGRKQYARSVSTPQVDPKTGQVYYTEYDPNTGQPRRIDIPDAVQETPGQVAERQAKAELSKQQRLAFQTRGQEMKAEMGQQRRDAIQLASQSREAEALLNKDTTITGGPAQVTRTLLGLFGVETEQGADAAVYNRQLKDMTLTGLARIKGPTTDFELGIVQSTIGDEWDAERANLALLKSIQRAAWFKDREMEQLQEWLAAGKDPDMFTFDESRTIDVNGKPVSFSTIKFSAAQEHKSVDQYLKDLRNTWSKK